MKRNIDESKSEDKFKLNYDYIIVDNDEDVLIDLVDISDFLNDKEVLEKIGFPLKNYLEENSDDVLAYGGDILCSCILDCLMYDGIINGVFSLDKNYNLTEYILKDANYTDKGIEELNISLGFKLEEVVNV